MNTLLIAYLLLGSAWLAANIGGYAGSTDHIDARSMRQAKRSARLILLTPVWPIAFVAVAALGLVKVTRTAIGADE